MTKGNSSWVRWEELNDTLEILSSIFFFNAELHP